MSSSKLPGPLGTKFSYIVPDRTPGPLGHLDQGDPDVLSWFGDVPGPVCALGRTATVASVGVMGRSTITALDPSKVVVPAPDGYYMPTAKSNPPKLTEEDIAKAAKELVVTEAAIYAVAKVESAGDGFYTDGRPKILFERHKFHKYTNGKFDKSHPELSQASAGGYTKDEWSRLNAAFALNAEAALESASWGKFQVMGFNHNGFLNVYKFVDAMFESEARHLESFLAYCKDNDLVKHLKAKDWAKFAKGYNGKDCAENRYDEKMKEAYDAFEKKLTEKEKAAAKPGSGVKK